MVADFIEIPLSQGKTAVIQGVDLELVQKYRWYAYFNRSNWYARTNIPSGKNRQAGLHMHALIAKPGKGLCVDHINGDGLDNRRCNLRVVTISQNSMNRKPHANNTSGHRGINWVPKIEKWGARIQVAKKRIVIGYFMEKELAIEAYEDAAKFHYGEFHRANGYQLERR